LLVLFIIFLPRGVLGSVMERFKAQHAAFVRDRRRDELMSKQRS
jgi:hypothetical protein